MTVATYLDTSALAKWYLNEPKADAFEAFVRTLSEAAISRLTVLEFRCLLARRRRAGEIGATVERRVLASFDKDVRGGFLEVHPLDDDHAVAATAIIGRLPRHGLRSLDALHLAIALAIGARVLATADRVMAEAAKALGIEVVRFD